MLESRTSSERSEVTAADQAREQFIRAASHDLREPLRSIAGLCGLALRDYGDRLDERGRDLLERALSAAGRMKALLDGLSNLARANGPHDAKVWFDAGESLDQALENLADLLETSGAKIERGPLPVIHGAAGRFPSVFQNLVANAVRYAAPGVSPKIRIGCRREGDAWRFAVSDNGVGVAGRDHQRIFEPFHRLSAAPHEGSAGLGLTICQEIVADFGGRIWVRSAPGQGATFYFTVKAAEADPRPAEQGVPASVFLLVEDSRRDAALAEEAFRSVRPDARLTVASDAETALAWLRGERADGPPLKPDAILLDLNLPGMSSREFLEAVRADAALRSIKVIALSAAAAFDDEDEPPDVDGVMAKPVDVDRLMRLVRHSRTPVSGVSILEAGERHHAA